MSEIFLYKKTAGISQEDLQTLRDNGLIPIGVDDFHDCKVLRIESEITGGIVFRAAIKAIRDHDPKDVSTVRKLFGGNLAEALCMPELVP